MNRSLSGGRLWGFSREWEQYVQNDDNKKTWLLESGFDMAGIKDVK